MKGCRPLSDAEIAAVERSLTGQFAARDRALFVLGIRSGFRISEILSLRRGDLEQAGRIIERVSVERRNMKKRLEGRTVLLHPAAREALAAWLRELPADPRAFVFQSRRGSNAAITRVQAWRILDRAFAAAGLSGKLGTHTMRKTFANKVYDRLGHDLIKTAAALGHRSVNSTMSYLSFREEEIDAAILAA